MLSGLALSLAFPPLGVWPLAWFALVPWYLVLTPPPLPPPLRRKGELPTSSIPALREAPDATAINSPFPLRGGGRGGGVTGFLFGLTLFLVGMVWMNEIGALVWVGLSFLQAIPFALLGMCCALLLPRLPAWLRPWVFAALWTLLEGLRGWGRYSFPWFLLASTQVREPAMIQVVSVTGQWGLSFGIALANGFLAEAWRHRADHRQGAKLLRHAVLVPAALGLGGVWTLRNIQQTGSIRQVAATQGSFLKPEGAYGAEDRAEVLRVYFDLTQQAAQSQTDLIAWPETVLPGVLLRDPDLYSAVSFLARATRTPLLVGSLDVDEQNRFYNSALLLDKNGVLAGHYDKTHLVPFGEFVPLRHYLPLLERYHAPQVDKQPGSRPGVLSSGGSPDRAFRVGVLICYESAFPRLSTDRVRQGAQALVLLTSDQTFGTTAGPYQHAELSILRAVETRRFLLRAATTGVSMVIDPWGRVRTSLGINRRGIVQDKIRLRDDLTFYARWGDWFLGVCALVVAAATARLCAEHHPSRAPIPAPAASDPGEIPKP